ncbi:DUF4123 domain-containing protein [Achromobacter aloeverae]
MRLYALLDGLLYARSAPSQPLERSEGAAALFDGTAEAALAAAGPWLIDWDRATPALRGHVDSLAAGSTGTSWLVSAAAVESLAQALRDRLDIRMPDGRSAWLRFHDARAMFGLTAMLSVAQQAQFFAPVAEWWTQLNGVLTRIYSHA